MMSEHEFTLVLDGDVEDDEVINSLLEHGGDDATFGTVGSVSFGEFHREADSFADAVFSAIDDVESVPGLRVLHVEPDDLVTASEIAERLNRTRESIRLLIAGERGGGNFPAPVSHLPSRTRLWRWSEVATWARIAYHEDREKAQLLAAVNAAL